MINNLVTHGISDAQVNAFSLYNICLGNCEAISEKRKPDFNFRLRLMRFHYTIYAQRLSIFILNFIAIIFAYDLISSAYREFFGAVCFYNVLSGAVKTD